MLITKWGASYFTIHLLKCIGIVFVLLSIIFVTSNKFSIHIANNPVLIHHEQVAFPDAAVLELTSLGQNVTTATKLCEWPPVHLHGRQPLNRQTFDEETLNKFYPFMSEGHFAPFKCIPNRKVAIIVPYRDREQQLKIFLNNVIPRIFRQQQEFGIYIVEQTQGTLFNKGMMANIGYKQAMEDMDYDCIIIHDVDIVPEDDRNHYTCGSNPIQMSTKVEKYGYILPYDYIAGGIVSFTPDQFKLINGFSNQYFGWGDEDTDLYDRIKKKNLTLTRKYEYGYCGSVNHTAAIKGNKRFDFKSDLYKFRDKDGLADLNYTLIQKLQKHLYVHVIAHIDMKMMKERFKEYGKNSTKKYK